MAEETTGRDISRATSLEKRRAILDAACRVFAEKGFGGASIRQIASAAGLRSHTHLYWYFRDKAEILLAALREGTDSARLPEFDELRDLTAARALERVARAYLRAFEEPRAVELFRIVLAESARDPEVRDEFGKAARSTTIDLLTEILEHHHAAGRLWAPRARTSATIFWGQLVMFVAIREVAPSVAGALPDPDGYVDEVVDTFLDGMRPRPPERET